MLILFWVQIKLPKFAGLGMCTSSINTHFNVNSMFLNGQILTPMWTMEYSQEDDQRHRNQQSS